MALHRSIIWLINAVVRKNCRYCGRIVLKHQRHLFTRPLCDRCRTDKAEGKR